MWRKKSFLSLFPITNSIGSLVFEPTSQLILKDPRALEWILPPMLKKIIGKEVSFETSKEQVKLNERHTHVIKLSSAMSPEKKLTAKLFLWREKGTFSLIIFPRNKNSFGSLVLNQPVNWFRKIQVHETSNRPLNTEQSFVSRKFHERDDHVIRLSGAISLEKN